MNINEIRPRQGNIEITGKVVKKEAERTFQKEGSNGRVCNALVEDSTGKVKLSLWNEQIDQVNEGDTVIIKNGYAGEWQGEIQLSTGKFGTLTVTKGEKPQASSDSSSSPKAPVSKEELDYDDSAVEEEYLDEE